MIYNDIIKSIYSSREIDDKIITESNEQQSHFSYLSMGLSNIWNKELENPPLT
jgi:hypothetical protein